MRGFFITQKTNRIYQRLSGCLAFALTFSLIFSPVASYAQAINFLNLPVPGTMIAPSAAFAPVLLKGMTIHPEDPLQFDFIIDSGNTDFTTDQVKTESEKLVKYFLAAMTVPKDDLWVNLSPYEEDRIIPDELGKTELGRDMLAQDYILKQLTASLMYPEKELGKKFWDKIYQRAKEEFGTSEIPVNTFNKVWIVPESATVYEHEQTVYVVHSRLKVMLDSDYQAQQYEGQEGSEKLEVRSRDLELQSSIIKEIIIPEIEREVNEGEHFAPLRQIYHSLILAKWYKETIKDSLLSQVYADKNMTAGVDVDDKTIKDQIYAQYMEAYKKGVFNYIKEDYDRLSNEMIPRKYFSGGIKGDIAIKRSFVPVHDSKHPQYQASVQVTPQKSGASSPIFVSKETRLLLKKLNSNDPKIREAAADKLGELKERKAVGSLIKKLKDEDMFVRITAADALGEIGDKRAINPLLKMIDDGLDVADQGHAVDAIIKIIGISKEVRNELIRLGVPGWLISMGLDSKLDQSSSPVGIKPQDIERDTQEIIGKMREKVEAISGTNQSASDYIRGKILDISMSERLQAFMSKRLEHLGAKKSWEKSVASGLGLVPFVEWVSQKFILPVNTTIEDLAELEREMMKIKDIIAAMANAGMDITLDNVGDASKNETDAEIYKEYYLKVIQFLAGQDDVREINLSIKFSGLVYEFYRTMHYKKADATESQRAEAAAKVREIKSRLVEVLTEMKKVSGKKTFLRIDIEEYGYRDVTEAIFREVTEEHPELVLTEDGRNMTLGIVTQAYLRDSIRVLEGLLNWAAEKNLRIPVRLVKGAYDKREKDWAQGIYTDEDRQKGNYFNDGKPYPSPVFREKESTDANYEYLSEFLVQNVEHFRTAFATHNPRTLAKAISLIKNYEALLKDYVSRYTLDVASNFELFEIQMLRGMGDEIKEAIVDIFGFSVRVYLPAGTFERSIGYGGRRFDELANPKNALYKIRRGDWSDFYAKPEFNENDGPIGGTFKVAGIGSGSSSPVESGEDAAKTFDRTILDLMHYIPRRSVMNIFKNTPGVGLGKMALADRAATLEEIGVTDDNQETFIAQLRAELEGLKKLDEELGNDRLAQLQAALDKRGGDNASSPVSERKNEIGKILSRVESFDGTTIRYADLDTGTGTFPSRFISIIRAQFPEAKIEEKSAESLRRFVEEANQLRGTSDSQVLHSFPVTEEYREIGLDDESMDIVTVNHPVQRFDLVEQAIRLVKKGGLIIIALADSDVLDGMDASIQNDFLNSGLKAEIIPVPEDYPKTGISGLKEEVLIVVSKPLEWEIVKSSSPIRNESAQRKKFIKAVLQSLDLLNEDTGYFEFNELVRSAVEGYRSGGVSPQEAVATLKLLMPTYQGRALTLLTELKIKMHIEILWQALHKLDRKQILAQMLVLGRDHGYQFIPVFGKDASDETKSILKASRSDSYFQKSIFEEDEERENSPFVYEMGLKEDFSLDNIGDIEAFGISELGMDIYKHIPQGLGLILMRTFKGKDGRPVFEAVHIDNGKGYDVEKYHHIGQTEDVTEEQEGAGLINRLLLESGRGHTIVVSLANEFEIRTGNKMFINEQEEESKSLVGAEVDELGETRTGLSEVKGTMKIFRLWSTKEQKDKAESSASDKSGLAASSSSPVEFEPAEINDRGDFVYKLVGLIGNGHGSSAEVDAGFVRRSMDHAMIVFEIDGTKETPAFIVWLDPREGLSIGDYSGIAEGQDELELERLGNDRVRITAKSDEHRFVIRERIPKRFLFVKGNGNLTGPSSSPVRGDNSREDQAEMGKGRVDSFTDVKPDVKVLALDLSGTMKSELNGSIAPGLADFIKAIHERGIAIVILSGDSFKTIDGFIAEAGIGQFIERGNVFSKMKKKDVLSKIKDEKGLGDHQIALIGNANSDILAAKEAGAISVAIDIDAHFLNEGRRRNSAVQFYNVGADAFVTEFSQKLFDYLTGKSGATVITGTDGKELSGEQLKDLDRLKETAAQVSENHIPGWIQDVLDAYSVAIQKSTEDARIAYLENKIEALMDIIREGRLRAGPDHSNSLRGARDISTPDQPVIYVNTESDELPEHSLLRLISTTNPDEDIKEFTKALEADSITKLMVYTQSVLSTGIKPLFDTGVFNLFKDAAGHFRTVQMTEIDALLKSRGKGNNKGVVHGVLYALAGLGWLDIQEPDINPDMLTGDETLEDLQFMVDQMKYTLTEKGKQVFPYLGLYAQVAEFGTVAEKMVDYLEGKKLDPPVPGRITLKHFNDLARNDWGLSKDPAVLDPDLRREMIAHLNGFLTGPVLIAMMKMGIADYRGPARGTHQFDGRNALNIENIKVLQRDDELIPIKKDGAFQFRDAAGDQLASQVRLDDAFNFLEYMGFVNKQGSRVRQTAKGLANFQRARNYPVPISYFPTYTVAETMMMGDIGSIQWKDQETDRELMVDRPLNVEGSGDSHKAYFKVVEKAFKALIQRRLDREEVPSVKDMEERITAGGKPYTLFISDVGTGDGAFLEALYGFLQETAYWQMMTARPDLYDFRLVGIDFNPEPLIITKARLQNAGIADKNIIVHKGDINAPRDVIEILERSGDKGGYGLAREEGIFVNSMLMHNRPWLDVDMKQAVARLKKNKGKAISEGAYVSPKGLYIPNFVVDQNLFEIHEKWADATDDMIIVELSQINYQTTRANLQSTLNPSYAYSHLLSFQYITPVAANIAIAREVWKRVEVQKVFPDSEKPTVSIVHHSNHEIAKGVDFDLSPSASSPVEVDVYSEKFQTEFLKGVRKGTHTFALIKPDALEAGLKDALIQELEKKGFDVEAGPEIGVSEKVVRAFYDIHKDWPFFEDLVAYLTAGYGVPLFLTADNNAVRRMNEIKWEVREALGVSDRTIPQSLFHSSDSIENAGKEAAIIFDYLAEIQGGAVNLEAYSAYAAANAQREVQETLDQTAGILKGGTFDLQQLSVLTKNMKALALRMNISDIEDKRADRFKTHGGYDAGYILFDQQDPQAGRLIRDKTMHGGRGRYEVVDGLKWIEALKNKLKEEFEDIAAQVKKLKDSGLEDQEKEDIQDRLEVVLTNFLEAVIALESTAGDQASSPVRHPLDGEVDESAYLGELTYTPGQLRDYLKLVGNKTPEEKHNVLNRIAIDAVDFTVKIRDRLLTGRDINEDDRREFFPFVQGIENTLTHNIENSIDAYLIKRKQNPGYTDNLHIHFYLIDEGDQFRLQMIANGVPLRALTTEEKTRLGSEVLGGRGVGGLIIYTMTGRIDPESKFDLIDRMEALGDEDGAIFELIVNKNKKGSSPVANITADQPGGIDLNAIEVERQGAGVSIQFDPVEVQQIIDMGIDGFAPVIINIVPLPSVLPLLGLEPRKDEEFELSRVN